MTGTTDVSQPTPWTDEQAWEYARIVGQKRKFIARQLDSLAGTLYEAFHRAAGNRKPRYERVPAWADLKEKIVVDAWKLVAEVSMLHWMANTPGAPERSPDVPEPGEPHVLTRLKAERQQLGDRIGLLSAFIGLGTDFQRMAESEQRLLVEQLSIMEKYDDVLRLRILNFKPLPEDAPEGLPDGKGVDGAVADQQG